jgi:hypothetical protein
VLCIEVEFREQSQDHENAGTGDLALLDAPEGRGRDVGATG